MFSKPLAFALLAVGCVTAAAGGAYVATRHNTADVAAVPAAMTAPAAPAPTPTAASGPVAETEAAVSPTPTDPAPAVKVEKEDPPPDARRPAPAAEQPVASRSRSARASAPRAIPVRDREPAPQPAQTMPAPPPPVPAAAAPVTASVTEPKPDVLKPLEPQPEPPRQPQFEEVVLPASSVIGLQVETALSSERARLEDRVDARVTRDVLVNGRVAIPAGSRVFGSVTLVDRGGKVKGTARLGIRFHTLVLADGSEVALNTEPFYREGESPAGDSAKKIGGATAVGAILGGILGGGKGAVIGGATGAAGGTAAAMSGDRNAAVVAPGSIVTVHLSAPATIQVEKRGS